MTMNHLVIAVSPDSSLELLGKYADVIVLDKDPNFDITKSYETLYIRSHFSTPELQPQRFRAEIESVVNQARQRNPNITFIDDMDTVDAIVKFEDKWQQHQIFFDFMPRTQLLVDSDGFKKPVFKRRLSSRGSGVTWRREEAIAPVEDWIVQESIDISEEVRIYVIRGEVYSLGAVRDSMTADQKTQAVSARDLSQDEINFAMTVAQKAPELEMIGLDVARSSDGALYVMEVNRSPGFGAFAKLTGVNLADILYAQPPTIIYKTALAVFKDKRMIMVRTTKNDEVFYTLGGKVEAGESDIACLHREVKEEAGVEIVDGSLKFLREFEAPAYGRENTLVNIKLYEGELASEPVPSSEVVEISYFDSSVDEKHLTAITLDMFAWLKAEGYIN